MGNIIGNKIYYYEKVGSTQEKLKQFAEKGLPEGLVVIAKQQTAARGRFSRHWWSPTGGLWFSFLLRPSISLDRISQITMLVSVGIINTLEKEKISLKIKWPNDIVCVEKDSLLKKVAGILTETTIRNKRLDYVVTGVGINVNNPLSNEIISIATSLKEIIKHKLSVDTIFRNFLKELNCLYNEFNTYGIERIFNKYKEMSILLDKKVKIVSEKKEYTGTVSEIDSEGGIILQINKKKKKF